MDPLQRGGDRKRIEGVECVTGEKVIAGFSAIGEWLRLVAYKKTKEKGSGPSANSSSGSNLIFNYMITFLGKMSIIISDISAGRRSF